MPCGGQDRSWGVSGLGSVSSKTDREPWCIGAQEIGSPSVPMTALRQTLFPMSSLQTHTPTPYNVTGRRTHRFCSSCSQLARQPKDKKSVQTAKTKSQCRHWLYLWLESCSGISPNPIFPSVKWSFSDYSEKLSKARGSPPHPLPPLHTWKKQQL